MRVEVTQKHIDEGIPNDPESCPIALAIQDKGVSVWVGTQIKLSSDGLWLDTISFAHTEVSTKFIRDFDRGNGVEPHTFLFKELT